MHNGYAQAEGVANLDQVPATGCLVDDRLSEVRRRPRRLRALHRHLPSGLEIRRVSRRSCRSAPAQE